MYKQMISYCSFCYESAAKVIHLFEKQAKMNVFFSIYLVFLRVMSDSYFFGMRN